MSDWILKTNAPDRWRFLRYAAILLGFALCVGNCDAGEVNRNDEH